jgi:multicomponent Na+:H+ antiporter subunit C
MESLLALVVGVLYAAGMYLLLRRALARVLMGIALLGSATNLLIFTAGRVTRGGVPIVSAEGEVLTQPYSDPLPQALVLTAIVIGFGVLAFAMVLVYRTLRVTGTEDADAYTETERPPGRSK